MKHKTDTLPEYPSDWPGSFGLYKYSKQAVRRSWPALLFLATLTAATFGVALYYDTREQPASLLLSLLLQLLAIFLSTASTYAFISSVRSQSVSLPAALNTAAQPLLLAKMVGTNLLVVVLFGLSLLAFIVPFFFVFPRLYLAPYFVVDKGVSPLEAIILSWNATEGHALKLWTVVATPVVMSLLVLTIIGIPFALYFIFMYGAAGAVTYFYLTRPANAADSVTV